MHFIVLPCYRDGRRLGEEMNFGCLRVPMTRNDAAGLKPPF